MVGSSDPMVMLPRSKLTLLSCAMFEQKPHDHLLLGFRDRRSASAAACCPLGELNRRGARGVCHIDIGAPFNECSDGRLAPIADGPVEGRDATLIGRVG